MLAYAAFPRAALAQDRVDQPARADQQGDQAPLATSWGSSPTTHSVIRLVGAVLARPARRLGRQPNAATSPRNPWPSSTHPPEETTTTTPANSPPPNLDWRRPRVTRPTSTTPRDATNAQRRTAVHRAGSTPPSEGGASVVRRHHCSRPGTVAFGGREVAEGRRGRSVETGRQAVCCESNSI